MTAESRPADDAGHVPAMTVDEATRQLDQGPPTAQDVRDLVESNREVVELLTTLRVKVDDAVTNFGPILDKLSSHPMFKMFGGKN